MNFLRPSPLLCVLLLEKENEKEKQTGAKKQPVIPNNLLFLPEGDERLGVDAAEENSTPVLT